MFEHKTDPLLPFHRFLKRLMRSALAILCLVVASLSVGVVGYRLTEHMTWVDAVLNASMILSGMGPAGEMQTTAGKLFASLYALYSGLVLIAITGAMLLPVFHRMLHKFHLEKAGKSDQL